TWGLATGSHSGTLTARGNGNNDLLDVRLFRGPGNFDGIADDESPEVLDIAAGSFAIASGGTTATVNIDFTGFTTGVIVAGYRWRDAANSANIIYGESVLQQNNSVAGGDPITQLTGLTLSPAGVAPEPAIGSLLAGLGLLGAMRRRTRRPLM